MVIINIHHDEEEFFVSSYESDKHSWERAVLMEMLLTI